MFLTSPRFEKTVTPQGLASDEEILFAQVHIGCNHSAIFTIEALPVSIEQNFRLPSARSQCPAQCLGVKKAQALPENVKQSPPCCPHRVASVLAIQERRFRNILGMTETGCDQGRTTSRTGPPPSGTGAASSLRRALISVAQTEDHVLDQ